MLAKECVFQAVMERLQGMVQDKASLIRHTELLVNAPILWWFIFTLRVKLFLCRAEEPSPKHCVNSVPKIYALSLAMYLFFISVLRLKDF